MQEIERLKNAALVAAESRPAAVGNLLLAAIDILAEDTPTPAAAMLAMNAYMASIREVYRDAPSR